MQAEKFYIYCTNAEIIEFAFRQYTVAFKQYQKKLCILHIVFISSVASSNKSSEFNLILVFIFLLNHKALYKLSFLEYPFQVKI